MLVLGVELRRSPRQIGGAQGDQPVAQGQGGADVVLVVRRDALEERGVGRRHVVLVLDDGGRTLVDLVAPLVGGQTFEVFEAVGLGPGLDRVAHHRVEVDEEARGDHVQQGRLTDAVLGRQALEG